MGVSRKLRLLLVFVSSLLSWHASAGPIIDGQEWYQPADLVGYTWNDLNAVCAGGPCSGMVGGTGPDLTGWTWASIFEVGDLFAATTPHPGGITEYVDPSSSALGFAFISLGFDTTTPLQVVIDFGISAVGGMSSTLAAPGSAYFGGVSADVFLSESRVGTDYTIPVDADDFFVGAWLYREAAVPAPASLPLLAVSLVLLGWSRRTRSPESRATVL